MIQTCKQCGAINQSSAEICCFCNARLSIEAEHDAVGVSNRSAETSVQTNSGTDGIQSVQPAWRKEVKKRVRTYRAQHHRSGDPDSQAALHFESESNEQASVEVEDQVGYEMIEEEPVRSRERENLSNQRNLSGPHDEFDQRTEALVDHRPEHDFDEEASTAVGQDEEQYEDPLQATLAAAARMASEEDTEAADERVEEQDEPIQQLLIDVSRPPEVESGWSSERPSISYESNDARPESVLFPVGDLSKRQRAGTVDAVVLALSYAGILGLFAAFGGRVAPIRLDIFICGSIALLLYFQYFTLFTIMGGTTLGMMLTGLRVISFDGSAPQPRQLVMRSVGYLISGAMGMLGYLWAFWDEDHLTWHDRISQTYLISAEELVREASSTGAQDGPPLAHL